jgi:hypothetical protein
MSTHNNTRIALIARMCTLEAQVQELMACFNSVQFTNGENIAVNTYIGNKYIASLQGVFPQLQGHFKPDVTCTFHSHHAAEHYILCNGNKNTMIIGVLEPVITLKNDTGNSEETQVQSLEELKQHLAPFCEFK